MAAKLPLVDSPHYNVFQQIVQTLRTPGTDLYRVVRQWYVWEGQPGDNDAISIASCPAIELTPSAGPDQFYGPSTIIGPLFVDVDCYTAGTSARDSFNLYHAVRRAFYPVDPVAQQKIHQALVAAGAEGMYLLQFTQGRFAPASIGKDAVFVASGQIQIRVQSSLST